MDPRLHSTFAPGPVGAGAPCRFCGAPLRHTFVDLGMSPLCQTHIEPRQLNRAEAFYSLHAHVCEGCFQRVKGGS